MTDEKHAKQFSLRSFPVVYTFSFPAPLQSTLAVMNLGVLNKFSLVFEFWKA